jgi:hypothetical protein
MDELKKINRYDIFTKLDNVTIQDTHIMCNELIDIVSISKARDRRVINDYADDEIIVQMSKINGKLHRYRYFTRKGLLRYIQEGHIYNYKNVCAYYGIRVRNFEHDEFDKLFKNSDKDADNDADNVTNGGNSKKVLKWIFKKRKQSKLLPNIITKKQLLEWLKLYDKDDLSMARKNKIMLWCCNDVGDDVGDGVGDGVGDDVGDDGVDGVGDDVGDDGVDGVDGVSNIDDVDGVDGVDGNDGDEYEININDSCPCVEYDEY